MQIVLRILVAGSSLLCSSLAVAQTYSDWTVGRIDGGGGYYAATVNDSGNVLGQYCYPEGCVYLLAFKTSCKQGSKYPVLVNSDKGSKAVELYCGRSLRNGYYQYIFTEFDEMHRTVLEAARVGFAFPLQGDEFIVVRFSLIGSNEAIDALSARTATPSGPRWRDTRDQRM